MTQLFLVRHGRASAGWDTDSDPGLDVLGRQQADRMADRIAPLGPLALVSSPLARCRETAAVLGRRWDVEPLIESSIGEIPSPDGVELGERTRWLRRVMAGTWAELDGGYTGFRDGVVDYLTSLADDTVIVSHFVAINAAIGAAVDDDAMVTRSLDNCSVTILESSRGRLALVEGGDEADTLIR